MTMLSYPIIFGIIYLIYCTQAIYVYIHVYIYIYVYVYLYIHMYMYLYIYIYVYIYTVYIYTYVYIPYTYYIHTYIYILLFYNVFVCSCPVTKRWRSNQLASLPDWSPARPLGRPRSSKTGRPGPYTP